MMEIKSAFFYIPMFILATVFVGCQSPTNGSGTGPEPPDQPTGGPGGSEYVHQTVRRSVHGEGGEQYWLFEPDDPRPESAPLIVFNHGWGAINPAAYGGWIRHLVGRGNIVVYPRYQATLFTPSEEYAPNAVAAIRDAIQRLQTEDHVRPELEHFAIVGHSMGGYLSAKLAAIAAEEGLPEPRAVMCVQPVSPDQIDWLDLPEGEFEQIPGETLFLTIAGDRDELVGEEGARFIFTNTPQIPFENKNYILMRSDEYGDPPLIADHYSPAASDLEFDSGEYTIVFLFVPRRVVENSIDALDYYGYWKLFDGLTDAAFYGTNSQYALGNTPEQRYMGTWADGTPVREPVIYDFVLNDAE